MYILLQLYHHQAETFGQSFMILFNDLWRAWVFITSGPPSSSGIIVQLDPRGFINDFKHFTYVLDDSF